MNIGQFYQSKTNKRDIVEIKGIVITTSHIDTNTISDFSNPAKGNWIGIVIHRHSNLFITNQGRFGVDEFLEKYAFCANSSRKVETIDGYEPVSSYEPKGDKYDNKR